MAKITKSIFFKPKNKALARKITIRTPSAFRKSIKVLKSKGITSEEKKSLLLAKTRARVQLKRRNLSPKERRQMKAIAETKLPNISVR